MTHDDEARQPERDESWDGLNESVRAALEILNPRRVDWRAQVPLPKPPPLPNVAVPVARAAQSAPRPSSAPGTTDAPVAISASEPPRSFDLELLRRQDRRRTWITTAAMALPIVAIVVIGVAGSQALRSQRAEPAPGHVPGQGIEAPQATPVAEPRPAPAVSPPERGFAPASAALTPSNDDKLPHIVVPETVIAGIRRERRVAAAISGTPPPIDTTADAALQAAEASSPQPQMAPTPTTAGRLSPVDSPLGTEPMAAPNATQIGIQEKPRVVVPSTEAQTPPTRLEPDGVTGHGRLDTRRR